MRPVSDHSIVVNVQKLQFSQTESDQSYADVQEDIELHSQDYVLIDRHAKREENSDPTFSERKLQLSLHDILHSVSIYLSEQRND